jgi:hypothetical protein
MSTLRRLHDWLHTRRSNFLLYSELTVGLPLYIAISFVSDANQPAWLRLFDVIVALGLGLLWGVLMWGIHVKRKIRRGDGIRSPHSAESRDDGRAT